MPMSGKKFGSAIRISSVGWSAGLTGGRPDTSNVRLKVGGVGGMKKTVPTPEAPGMDASALVARL